MAVQRVLLMAAAMLMLGACGDEVLVASPAASSEEDTRPVATTEATPTPVAPAATATTATTVRAPVTTVSLAPAAPTTTRVTPRTTVPAARTAPTIVAAGSTPGCHPSYTGACLPIGASDVDCAGGSGNGPAYSGRVQVVGPDVFDLDRDGDGIGCE